MRCTGHCCRGFFFGDNMLDLLTDPKGRGQDADVIIDMLIETDRPEHYNCKHLVDGNCAIYEDRPRMCSSYPNGRPCKIADCTRTE